MNSTKQQTTKKKVRKKNQINVYKRKLPQSQDSLALGYAIAQSNNANATAKIINRFIFNINMFDVVIEINLNVFKLY